MFSFFDQISGLISSVIDFVTNLINYLKLFFSMIFKSLLFVSELAMSLPDPVVLAFFTIACVAVIYLVVGR